MPVSTQRRAPGLVGPHLGVDPVQPAGAPSALASASLAANRAASEASGRSARCAVNSRSRIAGVRSSVCAEPVDVDDVDADSDDHGRIYSTVTDLARLRGWSTS